MLSPELEQAVRKALGDATRRGHEFSGLEHLLLALLDDNKTVAVIKKCGGTVPRVRAKLEQFLSTSLPVLPPPETDVSVETAQSAAESSEDRPEPGVPARHPERGQPHHRRGSRRGERPARLGGHVRRA
jgi:ATP-dependent Clp protease ATP-binding subunit ClpA